MNFSHENSVADSLREYGRGLAGGLIFALPLVCGAVLFAANIAPTDEIGVIAREASIGMLVTIMTFSILLGLSVLYFAAFLGSKQHLPERKWTWMTREILTAYAAALAASAYILYFFGSLPTDTPMQFLAGMIVVGLPAMLGASAGRLLLQLDD